jgi:predicted amidophosphoribosyltransferase
VNLIGLLDFVFPSRCAVCDQPGSDLCQNCRACLALSPHSFERAGLIGHAVTSYSQPVSKLLVAYKEKNQLALASVIASYMEPLKAQLPVGEYQIHIVPAPSRPANFAKRGFQPTLEIARALFSRQPGTKVLNALVLDSGVVDQVGLSKAARLANLAGSMKVTLDVAGKICIILDDVLTTGATALEAKRALSSAGALVVGLLVFSES